MAVRKKTGAAALERENAELRREVAALRRRQAASADILRTIVTVPGEAEATLQKIAETAQRLVRARAALVALVDGDQFRQAGAAGPQAEEFVSRLAELPVDGTTALGRAVLERRVVHLDDNRQLAHDIERGIGGGRRVPPRTLLAVPMMSGAKAIGVFGVNRLRKSAFDKADIRLLESLADQAVIAIENGRLLSELRESLESQTATAEVLGVISASPGELQPMFATILDNALRLCEAANGLVFRIEDDAFSVVAHRGLPRQWVIGVGSATLRPGTDTPAMEMVRTAATVHVADLRESESYRSGDPVVRAAADEGGVRTVLFVPMVRDGVVVGAINVHRREVRPFSDKQIALLASFAAQAVIAIENARLLSELRESLEQQTATSEVLGVISASPGEPKPVFDTILENAMRLCEAGMGYVYRVEDGSVRPAAARGGPPEYEAMLRDRGAWRPDERTGVVQAIRRKQPLLINDLREHPLYAERDATVVAMVESYGLRTLLHVPMLKDDEVIGVIILYRREVRPFIQKHIDLVAGFAAQAVIAIENARLLTELRESLDNQTASADILRAIASSPEDAAGVLDTIAETTARLFDAHDLNIRILEGGVLRFAASVGPTAERIRAGVEEGPPDPRRTSGAAILEKRQIHIADLADPAERAQWPTFAFTAEDDGSVVATPLMRHGEAIGAMVLLRKSSRPFTDTDLSQLANFADQAVIAIENARLLTELRESLERRTAMAEVLAMISSSPGEVQPVFEAMLDNAVRLCEATEGSVFSASGDMLRRIASRGATAYLAGHEEIRVVPGTPPGRMLSTRKTVHVPDLLAELSALRDSPGMAVARFAADRGIRSALWVPMIKGDAVIGAFVLQRREARTFTAAQIGLVESFANQAVIAIENARLLAELRIARDDAEAALSGLKAAQANLIQAEKMASLGQLTAGIAHEIKNPLNFVNNFAALSVELLDELKATAAPAMAGLDEDMREGIDEVVRMLTGNLGKIAEHGGRADGIVKSMLAHSRGGAGERRSVDLNALVEDALNLAYHGARAQDQNFNITLERDLDPSLVPIEVVPQDLTRVFLNLFGNGFYAANRRRIEAGDPAFEPVLKVATRDRGADVEIRVRDNGTGITPEIRAKLFEPFFTTKPTGEGTGLGLSISYEIVTRQHGGAIEVESEPGGFTEFSITIPKRFGMTVAGEDPMGSAAP